jgi:hypothetical protein
MISQKRPSLGKKAQMEMSVGTIVTIVLLMTVLILGLVLVRSIFRGSIENIDSIDQSVKNEINKLFSEDDGRRVVIYPPTREVSVKKGETGGFGFSIRNLKQSDTSFRYVVSLDSSSCEITAQQADSLIILGKEGTNINIVSGESMADPILVRFSISEAVPLCSIRYNLDVYDLTSGGALYGNTVSVDLKVTPN